MRIVQLEKTCGACPSQWEGKLDNGEYLYVRYRWGSLQVGIGTSIGDAVSNSTHLVQLGDGLDGSLGEGKMRANLAKLRGIT